MEGEPPHLPSPPAEEPAPPAEEVAPPPPALPMVLPPWEPAIPARKYCHSCWEEILESDCVEIPRSFHRACAVCSLCEEHLSPNAQPSKDFTFLVCEHCVPAGHFYLAISALRRLILEQEIYVAHEKKVAAEKLLAEKLASDPNYTPPATEQPPAVPVMAPPAPLPVIGAGLLFQPLQSKPPRPMSLYSAAAQLKIFLTNLQHTQLHPVVDNAAGNRKKALLKATRAIRPICVQIREIAAEIMRAPPPAPPPAAEVPIPMNEDSEDGTPISYADDEEEPLPPRIDPANIPTPSDLITLCNQILAETAPKARVAPLLVIDPSASDFVLSVPADVSRFILSILDMRSLCACRSVSTRWRAVADDEYVWKKLYFNRMGMEKPQGITWRTAYIRAYTALVDFIDENRMTRLLPFSANRGAQSLPSRPSVPDEMLRNAPLPRGFAAHPSTRAESFIPFSVKLSDELGCYYDFENQCRRSPIGPVFRNDDVAAALLLRYYRFMSLKAQHPEVLLIPTEDIEMVWITHMTRPHLYTFDCKKEFHSVMPHQLRATLAHHAFFWESLALTIRLWREAYNCEYLIREVDCAVEAKKQEQERKQAARDGLPARLILHQPPFFVHLAHRSNLMGEIRPGNPTEDTIIAFAKAQLDPNWRCPLQINQQDILRDRDWFSFVERYQREAFLKLRNPNAPLRESDSAAPPTPATQFVLRDESFRKASLKMYEKWLYLQARFPSYALETTYVIDLAHRAHMCNPLAYQEDSQQLLGKVLSRRPWPGQSGMEAYIRTAHLWKEEYGVDMEIDFLFSPLNEPGADSPYEFTKHDALMRLTKNYIASVYAPEVKQTRVTTIEDCISKGLCTFVATGMAFAVQEYFKCKTCPMQPDEGVCHTCVKTCHSGHKLELQPASRFYCDCGSSYACKALPL